MSQHVAANNCNTCTVGAPATALGQVKHAQLEQQWIDSIAKTSMHVFVNAGVYNYTHPIAYSDLSLLQDYHNYI